MASASPSSLPSAAVAEATKMLLGKRTGVAFAKRGTINAKENGIEDMNEFWNAAKTPTVDKVVAKQPLKQVVERRPRFSLPGAEEESPGEPKVKKYVAFSKNSNQSDWSPGELSRVSTIPPTPASPEVPEVVRTFEGDEEEVAAALPERWSSPAAAEPSMHDDGFDMDEDDDDMVPPPPPQEQDSDVELTPDEALISTPDAVDFPADQNNDNDDDDELDDDKEGAGFHMVHDSQTPESATQNPTEQENEQDMEEITVPERKRGRPKQSKDTDSVKSRRKKDPDSAKSRYTKDTSSVKSHPKKYKEADSVASTPTKKRKGKQTKTIYWSPVGYQSGPREYNPVPISDYKESPDSSGPRRSRRAKIPPLQFWKNERVEFGAHNEDGELGDAMGCMPEATAVLQALPTPYKKRETGGRFIPKAPSRQREPVFDNKKLKKQLAIIDGEDAHVWDEGIEDARDQKVVSYAKKLTITDLPLPRTRKKSEGKTVGKAAQSFNIPSDENDQYVGYIMGNLILPPNGIKDPESTGSCSQVFTVSTGQAGSIEVAFSDPHEEEGTFNPESAQRFLLGPGDQFRIPPGNCYRLQNHSKSTDSLLAWTIIRPRRVAGSP